MAALALSPMGATAEEPASTRGNLEERVSSMLDGILAPSFQGCLDERSTEAEISPEVASNAAWGWGSRAAGNASTQPAPAGSKSPKPHASRKWTKAERKAAREKEYLAIEAAVVRIVKSRGGRVISSIAGNLLQKKTPALFLAVKQRHGGLRAVVLQSSAMNLIERGPYRFIALVPEGYSKSDSVSDEPASKNCVDSSPRESLLASVVEKCARALEINEPQPISRIANILESDERKLAKRKHGSLKLFFLSNPRTFCVEGATVRRATGKVVGAEAGAKVVHIPFLPAHLHEAKKLRRVASKFSAIDKCTVRKTGGRVTAILEARNEGGAFLVAAGLLRRGIRATLATGSSA